MLPHTGYAHMLPAAAASAIEGLRGCTSVSLLPNSSVRGTVLSGYVASFEPDAKVSTHLMTQNIISGTSIYAINNVDLEETHVLNSLQKLGSAVPHESPQSFSISSQDTRIWQAAMVGPDSYVKVCRFLDIAEHVTSWFIVVRSALPISAREIETAFGTCTYAEMLASPSWKSYQNASSRNRNRLAATAALALGLRVDMHADATHTLASDPVNVAVPITEVTSNTFSFHPGKSGDEDRIMFYSGCANTEETRNGVLISPTANSELWLHGNPDTGLNMRGGPFSNAVFNAFPISTGPADTTAMPDARERATIARRMVWSNAMALNSSAVRARFKPIDSAWFSAANAKFGWSHEWGCTQLETIISKIAADDEHAMSLDMLLKLNESKSQDDVVISIKNGAIHNLIDNLAAVRFMMEGNGCSSLPAMSDIMANAESGNVHIPYQMLLALRDVMNQ